MSRITRPRHQRSLRRTALAAATAALAIVAAGCSSGTADDTAVQEATTDTAKEALDAAYAGFTGTPPTEPTTPKPGVSVWIVSCGEQVPTCSAPTAAAKEAAEAVGWEATTCDGQLNPDGWGTCVRQGISAGADVMLPVGLDCVTIQQPFEEAKAAGVMVVGAGGADCDATGGEKLWASERLQLEGVGIVEYWERAGAVAADYLIGSTDAKAQVLALEFTDPVWGPWLNKGFTDRINECEDCAIVDTLDMSNSDIAGGTGAGKFAAALQSATDANAVYVPLGGWMPAGFAQAAVASGRTDLVIASSFGDRANIGLVKAGEGQDAVLGYNTAWGAYGSIDTAIRLLNGEEPLVQGDGFQMVDAENNLPEGEGDYDGGVDYKTEYLKAWGVA